ncbi:rhodanese-like domain-containing protein [Hyphomicrobium sp.]|uniref:rhodanese-like domain-containing protein n=1 Tax=Hyphomicrobium sp. TaxID=82 RepID=UPI002E31C8A9|nr:rhodanese-like domain-containing protein [Hyphomicrobium sp.]HEX2840055.1 rhodanese-like domain-containing protein [Hyphomicrobium sp.]
MYAAFATAAFAGDENHFDPVTGFRIERYRAPTPDAVPGATTISVDDVRRLMRDEKAVLVDAMPAEGAGFDPKSGAWRLSKSREHIPGSSWLPDVGKGTLSPEMDTYFRLNLDRLTQGDRTRALIIYCLADCWMGWNAAKRAAAYGYTHVYWFPGGTDDWRDWEGPLENATPVPVIAQRREGG